MSKLLQIQSRAGFQEHLRAAMSRTQELMAEQPARAELSEVLAQLRAMTVATAAGLDPTPTEQQTASLSLLAFRYFEGSDPQHARLLNEVSYVFRRHHRLSRWQIMDGGRHGILQVWSGAGAFRKVVLAPGESRSVGSGDGADLRIDDDELAEVHLEVYWDGVVGRIRDRTGGATAIAIHGEQGWRGEVGNSEIISVGHTELRFLVEFWTPPDSDVDRTARADELRGTLDELRPLAQGGELYAVIDAARSTRALTLLEESRDPYMSLYDGVKGRKLDDVAPYLVRFGGDLRLLDQFILEGLGDSWGIFLVSSAEHLRLRRHLRKFLKVELEGEKRPVFFRFYDPRVLRDFLVIATQAQREELFGEGIREIGVESAKADGSTSVCLHSVSSTDPPSLLR